MNTDAAALTYASVSREVSSRWVFTTAFLAIFSLTYCRSAVAFNHIQAATRYGEYFNAFGSMPGTVIIQLLAILVGIYLVELVGYRTMLIAGATIQAAAMILQLSLPVVFTIAGELPTWLGMALVQYLQTASGGLNLALAYLLVSTLWTWDPFHAWGRLFAAAPLAVWVSNAASGQNESVSIWLGLTATAAYAGSVMYIQFRKIEIEVEDAPIVAKLSSLLDTRFLCLGSLAALTWVACSLDLFSYSRVAISDSVTPEFLGRSVQIIGPTFIATVLLLGHLRKLVSDYDLILAGAVCCLIGSIKLGTSTSETDFFRAWLFLTVGGALSKPLLMSWATTWMGNGTRLYIGALLAFTSACSAMISVGLPMMGFEKSLESFQVHCWIGGTLSAILAAIYSGIIFTKQEGMIYRFFTHLHWPANKTLANIIGWSMFGVLTSIASPPAAEDWQQLIGQYILKFVYSYVFGPFWSSFWVLSLMANLLAIYISSVILMRRTDEISLAKQAFTGLFFMAMFAIWLEPWMTVEGVALNVLTAYFQVSVFFFVDIAATLGWLWALSKVHSRLNEL
jgi:hypothetical protein